VPIALDDDHRRVVEHESGPLLVLAGPGTGKTTTLVEAIADRDPDRAEAAATAHFTSVIAALTAPTPLPGGTA
jgi:DNA-binding GntR family transcriptional regulator